MPAVPQFPYFRNQREKFLGVGGWEGSIMLDSQAIKEQAGRRGGPEWVREFKPCSPARDTPPPPAESRAPNRNPEHPGRAAKLAAFHYQRLHPKRQGEKKIQSFCNPIHHSNKNDFTLIKI